MVSVKKRAVLYKDPLTGEMQVYDNTLCAYAEVEGWIPPDSPFKSGVFQRVFRVYEVKLKDGRMFTGRLDDSGRWVVALDRKMEPVRKGQISEAKDITLAWYLQAVEP